MDSSFTTDGGLRIGGQSDFFHDYLPGCNLIFSETGLMDALDALTAKWATGYQVGLFSNDVQPWVTMTLGAIIPAVFSGYTGLVALTGFAASVMQGVRSVSEGYPITYTHNGGPLGCWVYGYYVVNAAGHLEWAERFCPTPWPMVSLGQKVRVLPRATVRNEFPKESV